MANNSADGGTGGGICTISASVHIGASAINNHVAGQSGGGVGIFGGRVFFSSSTLDHNVAGPGDRGGNGGGLYVNGKSKVHLLLSRVRGNLASREGGGTWNGADSSIRVERTIIRGNRALGDDADQGGGGLFNNGGLLAVVRSTVLGNAASGEAGSGGGIVSAGGHVFVSQSTIDRNYAIRAGGDVEVINGQFGLVDTSAIRENVASAQAGPGTGNGGALHVSGANASINIRDSAIARNDAGNEGGGLWNQAGSQMNILRTFIVDNQAFGLNNGKGGGGIFNNGGGVFTDANGVTDLGQTTVSGNIPNNLAGPGPVI